MAYKGAFRTVIISYKTSRNGPALRRGFGVNFSTFPGYVKKRSNFGVLNGVLKCKIRCHQYIRQKVSNDTIYEKTSNEYTPPNTTNK